VEEVALKSETELRTLVETECEGVLQAVLAARQDLREWLDGDGDRASVATAEDALRGCVVVLQTVLRASRAAAGATDLGGRARGIVELLSGPYCFVLPDGHILYFNRALAALLGREREDINRVPFASRPWGDMSVMRHHLEEAARTGHAVDVIELRTGRGVEGDPVQMVLRSQRLEEEVGDQPLLLMTIDRA
jgi:PAS domain-containing protein